MKCSKCDIDHSIEMFRNDRSRNSGYYPYCKSCEKLAKSKWYSENVDYVKSKTKKRNIEKKEHVAAAKKRWQQANKDKIRAIALKHSFGITNEDYLQMLTSQHGKCAICTKTPEEGIFLCVDHDHKTGKIRGLLCHRCNKLLGFAQDSVETLNEAISYLRKSSKGGSNETS